ncbi:hypothetical protein AQUCO_01200007v1 [Aquilegia coerulea]|uniref:DUF4408 domain-containing protein n=1 Tax=Aquilegia coerulea TaxID=218851 RepID=A0A2G5E429_AQUCA|nr:hypothetical protein AQUCO_01200007v1 [Aquilegia coerulea]
MDKSQKSLIAKLLLIALLLISPLLSTSMRPYFLYFLLNLVIIALGAEAGILSFLKPLEDNKVVVEGNSNVTIHKNIAQGNETKSKANVRVLVKRTSVGVVKKDEVNRCNALPSLFFIGSGEVETETNEAWEVEEEGGLSAQELFNKAETFIGNFYQQVKLQRQESCKQIHGFY